MTIAATAPPRNAPGPRGHFLLGNLSTFKRDPIGMLLDLHHEFGDVVRNRLGPYVTHAVIHPDFVKYILQDNYKNYVRGKFYARFKLFFGDGLLTMDGPAWLQHRRIAQPLFHRRTVEEVATIITTATTAMLERWEAHTAHGAPVDMVPEMMRLTLSILGQTILGLDISDAAPEVGQAVRVGLRAMMPAASLNEMIPPWIPTPYNRQVRRAQRTLHQIVDRVIAEHRRGDRDSTDLVALLLASRDEETGAGLSDREVHDEVMTIFLAGHETTGTGLAWSLYAIAKHPEVRRKLEAEVDTVLSGRTPTLEDLPRLPYSRMVVEESLRVYPPIWGFTRDAVAEDEIGGYHIPAGSSIFLSPYITHRHPAFWDNPDAFDPERFAPEQAAARPRFAYFPFGGGPRKCIGNHLALLQMQLAVAMIAQRYHLHPLPGHPVQHGALVSLHPLHGIRMRVRSRRP